MRSLLSVASGIAITAMLAACALLPHRAHMVKVRPIETPAAAAGSSADDGTYASAARAIEQRSYAAALDLLQVARDRSPRDVRVLNALGVVYDKLGRFDLSARYYAQAEALDPKSTIVRENLAYSARLQAVEQRSAQLAEGSPTASAPIRVARAPLLAKPLVILPAAASSATIHVALTGHPLMLTNATGVASRAEPLRVRLVRLGWSAPASVLRTGTVQNYSEIVYSPADRLVARALARTIPVKVKTHACNNDCEGVHLIIGTDSLAWSLSRPHRMGRRV